MILLRHFPSITLLVILAFGCKPEPDANDKKQRFIDNLISQMTLEEKLGQLNLVTGGDIVTGQSVSDNVAKKIAEGKVGGLFNIKSVEKVATIQKIAVEQSRLKIPLLFGMDVIHGYETTFPIPLALASSWNREAIEKSARIAAQEATAQGINWTFSPMVDLSRDPRWGRVAEGSGEDPFLGSEIAKSMVKGYQGTDLTANNTMLACVKHFALYGAPDAGRDYNTVDMSRLRMYNEYFPPYKAAIDAGAGSVMASFNEVDGIPATGNRWLMTEVLRNQWGFKGFVVTDYTGIKEMIEHGVGDFQQVSALALNAGIDMDMVSEGFLKTLPQSLNEGKVSMQKIDHSVRLILSAKYDLGLFDDPYLYCNQERAKNEVFTSENRNIARQIAGESMVLLKNENKLLPLKKSGTIALVGPLADSKENMAGTWSVATRLDQCISLKQGLEEAVGSSAKILYAKGSNLTYDPVLESNATMFGRSLNRDNRTDAQLLHEALQVAAKADIVVAALGESSEMSGESSCRTRLGIPDAQKDLLNTLLKTGKPVVLVLFAGRPLVLTEENEKLETILLAWFGGSEAGHAIADILFGDVNPSGKLPMTFPRHESQIPLFYNHKNTGRPLEFTDGRFEKFRTGYLDETNNPLFAFGFGLSYTQFEYKNLTLSKNTMRPDEKITVTVDVVNVGRFDGKEIIQLYIRDKVGTITRPVMELKGFQKQGIKQGGQKTVIFEIGIDDLKFYNPALEWIAEPGDFDIFIGKNSTEYLSASFTLLP